jgi:cytochrome P450
LFTAEGDEWRIQRKLVMRALTPEVIRNFFPVLSAMTERLLNRWQTAVRAGHAVNLLRDLKAFTLDVTIGLAMGQDINTLEHDDNPLQRDIDLIFRRVASRITSPIQYWRYFRLAPDRAADAAAERVAQAVEGFIAQTRKRLEEQPHLRDKPANMLEALVTTRDEPGSEFTDAHVMGNAVTMVFAGEDTTSNSIAWLLYLFAQNPEAAGRLQAEVDAVVGADSVLRQFASLDAFPYADAAISEAMRLKPVAPAQTMETNRDMQIGDVLVPQGTLVMALFRQSSRMTCHFTDPDMFMPERWLDGGSVATDGIGGQVFPFGGGPRFCPGRYLALAEIKMVVSMLIRNFTMELDVSAPPVQELFTFTMTPDSLPVRLMER